MEEKITDGSGKGKVIEGAFMRKSKKGSKPVRKRGAFVMSELLVKYQTIPSLPPDHARNILARIYPRMNELAIPSERRLSLMATNQPETVRTIRRQVELGKQVGISAPTLHALARPLQLRPQWLQFGTGAREATKEESTIVMMTRRTPDLAAMKRARGNEATLTLRGTIMSGGWFGEGVNPPTVGTVPPQADLAFPSGTQYAVLVGDDSMNRHAQPGDFLITLDAENTDIDPTDHLVVVSRTMKNANLRELTTRRYSATAGGKVELRLESNDSRFKDQEHLMLNDPSVSVLGIVLAIYRRVF